jgi:hypothetical protein
MKLKTYATIGIATGLMLAGTLCQSVTRWIDGDVVSVAAAYDSGDEEKEKNKPSVSPGAGSGGGEKGASPAAPASGQGAMDPATAATINSAATSCPRVSACCTTSQPPRPSRAALANTCRASAATVWPNTTWKCFRRASR